MKIFTGIAIDYLFYSNLRLRYAALTEIKGNFLNDFKELDELP